MNFIYLIKFSTLLFIKLDLVVDVDSSISYGLIRITSLSSTFPFYLSLFSLCSSCIS